MAARSDAFTRLTGAPPSTEADARPAAVILPLRRTDPLGRKLVDETSGDRLGPARGLVIGLALSAGMWACLGILTWASFRL